MDISSDETELIVKQVIADLGAPEKSQAPGLSMFTLSSLDRQSSITVYGSRTGNDSVFDGVEGAIEAAYQAQQGYVANYKVYDRQRIIEAIRKTARDHVETICHTIVEETKMEHYEDKLEGHLAVINRAPGPDCLDTETISGDGGLVLEGYAPFGVITAITPTTDPTETIINNTISMIVGGNAVVFNVHLTAKQVSAYCLQLLNRVVVDAGGSENLITMAKEPTVENVSKLAASPHIRMTTGAGGMGTVNALLRSGKKTIGTGVDSPPVIVDETTDVELAGREVYKGVSFDNSILCFTEKEVFVVESTVDGLLYNFREQGAYLLDSTQTEHLLSIVFQPKEQGSGYEANKRWVGRDASRALEQIEITGVGTRLLICEVEKDYLLVTVEQMMSTPPIVHYRGFEQAVEWAVKVEHGNRHTISIFSKDVEYMARFAKVVKTTTCVKNRATMTGVGIRGENHCTMTIAGPTGEGTTNAKSFTRRKRCMLAEGGLRII